MPADRVSLTEGYAGAQQKGRAIGDEAETVDSQAKKQHGHTEAFLASNKGALAAQGGNGSTATANSFEAGSGMHATNAENTEHFLRDTAGHEEHAASTQAGESKAAEAQADDLRARVNRGRS